MKTIFWMLGLLLLVVAGTAVFVWSGAYNIAADEPHWRLTERAMETLRHRSIAARASGIDVPSLDDEPLIRAGAGNYDAMCTACHLKPGVKRTEQSSGLYPAPPNLVRHHVEDPAAAFWVIKHGVKMSGMPAWGKSMDDESIWGMVAFLRQLPDMSRERYHTIVEASDGHRHSEPASPTEKSETGDDSKAPPHHH